MTNINPNSVQGGDGGAHCTVNVLPFSDIDVENNIDITILEQSLINPSQMPDSSYEYFKNRGLHIIHINARSLAKKCQK